MSDSSKFDPPREHLHTRTMHAIPKHRHSWMAIFSAVSHRILLNLASKQSSPGTEPACMSKVCKLSPSFAQRGIVSYMQMTKRRIHLSYDSNFVGSSLGFPDQRLSLIASRKNISMYSLNRCVPYLLALVLRGLDK